jgi:hypothetical protein
LVGLNPEPLTLRELLWMAEGRSRENWQHTSMLLTMLFNCNRDPKRSKPAKPSDFNPFCTGNGQTVLITKENIGQLRKYFKGH